jgi:hypothetical protein
MSIARSLAAILLLTTIGCGGGAEGGGPEGEWSGTVTTEGDVTTVVNESGSVWGGEVALVEEASIGVDAGEDPYMLGQVRALAATNDEIYLLDQQVPAVRVYDMDGRHLRDIGAKGSGPGEFTEPDSMVIGPDGRVYVRDSQGARITIFSPAGEQLGTIPLRGGYFTSTPMVIIPDGTLYNYERVESDDPDARASGMVPRSVESDRSGDPILPPDLFDFDPWRLEARTENMFMSSSVPFAPATIWEVAPSGAVIAGVSNEYSFEVRYPDGKVTRVVKPGERVPVDPAEGDWHRKRATAQMRRSVDTWVWNGENVPSVKPAYQQFIPDHSGRVWVVRPGLGYHVEGECDENPEPVLGPRTPCWRSTTSWEVFDEEGRFLGGVELPEGVGSYPDPYIRGDMFLAPVTDDYGTTMVKRYRLEYPEAE